MAFKGAIFDLDGVIVDSVPLHYEAWHRLFATDFGIHFDENTYEEKVDGKPRLDSIRMLLPQLTEEDVVQAGDKKQSYYLEMLQTGRLKRFPPAIKLIKELKDKKVKLAAASSSKNTRRILELIELAADFDAIITGYDITHGKPHPEIFLKAAQEINLPITECVVFEDSLAGVQAAKAGGFLCVGIDRHNHPSHYKLADLHISDLEKVTYSVLQKMFDE